MKISKSKQELASIISENGGWRDGAESAAQCKSDNAVSFYRDIPDRGGDCWWGENLDGRDIGQDKLIANWHQTILSRAEYFKLYPATDAEDKLSDDAVLAAKGALMSDSIEELVRKPTIEQLAADYRNANDYAQRKQQEADDAKADAEERLKALELAGEALWLLVSPITAKQEPELVITDWRNLKVGDEVEYVSGLISSRNGMVGIVAGFADDGDGLNVKLDLQNGECGWPTKWRFIRRP